MQQPRQAGESKRPWGKIVAVLAACMVTLIGVAANLAPETIFVRALGAALLLGSAASVASYLVERFLYSR